MEDAQIVQLYWDRSEQAIDETAAKYGPYCHSIAIRILQDSQDAEECVNDTYLSAWNAMPPHRPSVLATFLGKITRRLSIDRWRTKSRSKRGADQVILALDELRECVDARNSIDHIIEAKALTACINRFLDDLPAGQRCIFLQRYWYLAPIDQIASANGYSRSKVTSMLYRLRKALREHLEKEGFL